MSIETWCLGKCKGVWWAKARVCGGQRCGGQGQGQGCVVGEGKGVWWEGKQGRASEGLTRGRSQWMGGGVKQKTSTLNTWMLNFCT
jgi:hypothetical protein